MEFLYQNFDKLDITFQGVVSQPVLDKLKEAKAEAQKQKEPFKTSIGKNPIQVEVLETGTSGGYTYQFSTGMDGESWAVTDTPNRKAWGIRVSVSSMGLMLNGYAKTKARIITLLENFGAEGPHQEPHLNHQDYYKRSGLLERISRFDYCFDFADRESTFEPKPDNFVAHSNTKKQRHGNLIDEDIMDTVAGNRVETVTLGKLPNRQVSIYDKTREILVKRKPYWWQAWGLNKNTFEGKVWRFEIRAGKDELDSWGLKRFKDFETKAGDVISGILSAIRYAEPSATKNRSRWPNSAIWNDLIALSEAVLAPYSSNAKRERVIETAINQRIVMLKKNMYGLINSLVELEEKEPEEYTSYLESIIHEFEDFFLHKNL